MLRCFEEAVEGRPVEACGRFDSMFCWCEVECVEVPFDEAKVRVVRVC